MKILILVNLQPNLGLITQSLNISFNWGSSYVSHKDDYLSSWGSSYDSLYRRMMKILTFSQTIPMMGSFQLMVRQVIILGIFVQLLLMFHGIASSFHAGTVCLVLHVELGKFIVINTKSSKFLKQIFFFKHITHMYRLLQFCNNKLYLTKNAHYKKS